MEAPQVPAPNTHRVPAPATISGVTFGSDAAGLRKPTKQPSSMMLPGNHLGSTEYLCTEPGRLGRGQSWGVRGGLGPGRPAARLCLRGRKTVWRTVPRPRTSEGPALAEVSQAAGRKADCGEDGRLTLPRLSTPALGGLDTVGVHTDARVESTKSCPAPLPRHRVAHGKLINPFLLQGGRRENSTCPVRVVSGLNEIMLINSPHDIKLLYFSFQINTKINILVMEKQWKFPH